MAAKIIDGKSLAAQLRHSLKSAIAAVNGTYDNLSKVAKQFADMTQSNIEAVAKQAVNGAKKAKKAA